MCWRLTYTLRSHGISEDEPLWTDTTHTWNMEGVESDGEAAEKAKVFLEEKIRRCESVQSFKLVRIVQEEVTVPVKMLPPRSYGELKWPKVAS
ncbi:MAG: hypothetical protein A3C70_01390 [Candidatus Zambryskibacteria bacterium RIFCSPHIGHO2_02_FULL_43_14]|uniref:Uncharacterized protein n=1 Tax=Candidatus Zambryskibacteria bacterium RIFCSPHIGHO2_02_FULL_43_14 TaxID=1802748 RepID=A0A1G2TFK0_9BACT|nr:MAG: hypothetical protein A2829_02475 [Candidatus Zambryskibacteria bacterium RIFCSPHIGHO2_01_FULL_43_60]OHA96064.1 MAG: hypothetical protein A3C70_01390 [Candidatus Zambryskibacteria bacterium RIFCSPHIGHO2_02_FULL_43_14]OHB02829.1 MAG: hypothetical protein A3B03_00240 [Candidatus Zambryskibacteria bacterium RIFCSPLOWO2_01_FULL_42_41]